jgi:signal transduction histidine kinase/CheY-like chemotaxis protein
MKPKLLESLVQHRPRGSISRQTVLSAARRYLVALLIVGVASAIRQLFFGDLGRGIPYLTYYPAVMLAALYGGLVAGLLSTAASGLLSFFWVQQGSVSSAETLAIVVFGVSCTMISLITEAMRRANRRAGEARRQAEAANRAKSVFLANMSHELRTPLNAILGFSKLMRNDISSTPEQSRTLEIISRSGEHLLGLINSVLEMAKIEAGRVGLEEAVFDAHAMMRDLAAMMRGRAEAKGLQVTLEMAQDFPRGVLADEGKLRQVVLNLLGNAVKFTSHGGVTLRLATKPTGESDRVTLVFEVEDTGGGIGEEDQERIFEPFVQLGGRSDQEGTGLGLSIARQFVVLMGGTLGVESELGKGSVFRVEVPVELPDVAALTAARVKDAGLARLAPGQPEYRVLIVEDNDENWQLLQDLLQRAGFEVRVAKNGAEGVAAFESWRPHLIWMDWRMPVMDGLEATRRIRAMKGGGDVKIVALSASVAPEEQEQLMAAGADYFAPKPIHFDAIYDCLARQLGVRFGYDEAAVPAAMVSPADLDREALQALPSPLRTELEQALASLEAAQIEEVVRRVSLCDSALAAALAGRAERLEYSAMLRAVRACDGTTDQESKVRP